MNLIKNPSFLSKDCRDFLTGILREFHFSYDGLMTSREERKNKIESGQYEFDFDKKTAFIRDRNWIAREAPGDVQRRLVEITGPADAKIVINGLSSGADVFMADIEDSLAPSWENVMKAHESLFSATRGYLETKVGNKYYMQKKSNTKLFVRPRGLHLAEMNVRIGEKAMPAALFDVGLYIYNNWEAILKNNDGIYLYLPKIESREEAKFWEDVFRYIEDRLGIDYGAIRVTVLIETLPAVFQMDEIIYELRNRILGLNAGRWDYIFSIIKSFHSNNDFNLPDRCQLTMDTNFMTNYSNLIVQTCHRRGIHAIGGMSAFIPNKNDKKLTKLAVNKVIEDKKREVNQGFDGSWVAHPALVPVVAEVFTEHLKYTKNQKHNPGIEKLITKSDLLNFSIPKKAISEAGVRTNIRVCMYYLYHWFQGVGAVNIDNSMEDLATAEISRSQLWLWRNRDTIISRDTINGELMFHHLLDDEFKNLSGEKEILKECQSTLLKLVNSRKLPDFMDTYITTKFA